MNREQIENAIKCCNPYDEDCGSCPFNDLPLGRCFEMLAKTAFNMLLEDREKLQKQVKEYKDKIEQGTAEKFAEKLKELEEALLEMVVQFCQMVDEGELRHTFMSAEENAFDVLDIDYGEKVDDVYERFNKKWDRPIDEILKEIKGG